MNNRIDVVHKTNTLFNTSEDGTIICGNLTKPSCKCLTQTKRKTKTVVKVTKIRDATDFKSGSILSVAINVIGLDTN